MLRSAELQIAYHDRIDKAREFLKEHEAADGTMTAQDAATFAKMEKEIRDLKAQAQAESFKEEKEDMTFFEHMEMGKARLIPSDDFEDEPATSSAKPYVSCRKYKENFFKAMRKKFKAGDTVKLVEGSPTQGGYLVPSEFNDEIQSALEEENVIRQMATVISTESEHLIPYVSTKPAATWISEGQTINLTTETFERITLGAHKLGAAITLSNELLADSQYDLQAHLTLEFAKSLARKEEEAFLLGDGDGQPTGILTTFAANSDCWKETQSSGLTADDLINLQYSVPRAYRKNACWLVSDETMALIRRLKDSTQNFIWQPSLTESEPARLLGRPIYSSPYMPSPDSGKIAVIFGDWEYYVIAERGQRTCRALRELFALQDVSAFLMLERIDGKLTDAQALRGLKIK